MKNISGLICVFILLASCKKDGSNLENTYTVAGKRYTANYAIGSERGSGYGLYARSEEKQPNIDFEFHRYPAPGSVRIWDGRLVDTSNFCSITVTTYDSIGRTKKYSGANVQNAVLGVSYDAGKLVVTCPNVWLMNLFFQKDSIQVAAFLREQ